ncbi:MAG: tol-pal system-associated acyl-CoA thioesterase [Pseudomonadota bacterium]
MSEPVTYTLPIRIYYGDTDFSGVVYHAAYLEFFERGRTEALRAVGVDHKALLAMDDPLAYAVRKMNIEWIAPAHIDDLLEVRTRYPSTRGARIFAEQEIWRGEALLCRAEVEIVSITLDGRPRRPPEHVKQAFTAHAEAVNGEKTD